MKFTALSLLPVLLAATLCSAQQGITKPVISVPPPEPAAPASAPALAPAGPVQVSASYVIGPEDAIQITVWKEPNLSSSLSVRPDGMISMPLLGDVQAAGMTPMLLGADITARLKKYITDPTVTVTVSAVNSKRVYLVGEVQHIGAMAMTPEMTPLQAIAAAGGLSPYANSKHIYILRGAQGSQKKIPFNYKKAVKDGDMQGITLAPGDTIVIP